MTVADKERAGSLHSMQPARQKMTSRRMVAELIKCVGEGLLCCAENRLILPCRTHRPFPFLQGGGVVSGRVFKVRCRLSGRIWAMKGIKKHSLLQSQREVADVLEEKKLLPTLDHSPL
eukprot:NODE_2597_length_1159_cov_25.692793_g2375_i0.p1 GENE.NODE_2597_length_1159_cov_25.692793_g2375_i0~~NODE_2597_length_1159_cov_25.692793_g2375_i0.p1  ORF type:complete len:118 (-),score=11.89 NODE_2597_length_1159_cov_25.692793_g2375_i0:388-741(-)